MQDPSLVVVPYRYKSAKLYSEIPISGIGDFTVGRLLNTATRVNSNGNIEVVNANIPRLDYYTTGGVAGCPALLVEPSAQNLALQSEAFNNASWLKTQINTTGTPPWVDVETAPDGTTTADKIIATAASGNHFISRAGSTQIGQHTFSIFAKAAEYGFIRLQDVNAGKYNAGFDLTNGTSTGAGASIQNYGNGWYRCIVSYDGAGATVANAFMGIPTSGASISYTGDGISGIYAWGAQLETGSVATSYIPTTTGSVTRNADVISVSGAVSGLIGQSEGTIYAEVDARNFTSGARIFVISDGTQDNRVAFLFNSTNRIRALISFSVTTQFDANTSTGLSSGIYKLAVAYANNDFAFYVNGSQIATDNTGSVPACSQVFIGKTESTSTSNICNDRIRAAAIYNSRLDDADLMVLTSPTYYSNVRDMIWDTFVARNSTFSELPGCLQTRHNELITL
jgi:hypothetical protein